MCVASLFSRKQVLGVPTNTINVMYVARYLVLDPIDIEGVNCIALAIEPFLGPCYWSYQDSDIIVDITNLVIGKRAVLGFCEPCGFL